MRFCLLPLMLIGAGGCSLGFNYQQCTTNDDCAQYGGQPYCTNDGLCVPDPTPRDLCSEQYPAEAPPNALPIGAMFNLAEGSPDPARIAALKLGLDELNDQSRFNRNIRPLVAYVCDTGKARQDENRQQDLVAMINYLAMGSADDQRLPVFGIVGPTTNADVSAVLSASATQGVPIISPSADAATFDQAAGMGFFFRTPPAANLQMQKLAQSATDIPNNNPPTSAVILTLVSELSDYGEGLRQTFQGRWSERNQANVPALSKSFPESLDATMKVVDVGNSILAQDQPPNQPTHVLVLIGHAAQPLLLTLLGVIKDLKTYNIAGKGTQVWVSDGGVAANLLPLALDPAYDKILPNVQGIAPLGINRITVNNKLQPTQSASDFIANMKAAKMVTITPEAGDYDIFIGYTYDAFYTLAMAVESVRGEDASAKQVAIAMRRIKSTSKQFDIGAGAFGTFVTGVSSLQSGGEVSITGVTGTLRFNAQGDREPALYERWKIEKIAGMMPMTPPTSQITFKPF